MAWQKYEMFKNFDQEVDKIAHVFNDTDGNDKKKRMAFHKKHPQNTLLLTFDLVVEYAQMEKWNTWPADLVPDSAGPNLKND